jgi:hypothetical protein
VASKAFMLLQSTHSLHVAAADGGKLEKRNSSNGKVMEAIVRRLLAM